MCRFLVVKSKEPVQLSHFTTRPVHSIIKQASDCRLRLDGGPINADGFGIGWYDQLDGTHANDSANEPCVFQAITPAWSNRNLRRLAEKVRSPLVFAHVRAATEAPLSEENCHPWTWGCLMWMHNGCVANFHKIKRKLQAELDDELYNYPQGSTDSEYCFALFLQVLKRTSDIHTATQYPHKVLRQAMLEVIDLLNKWSGEVGCTEPSLLNFCVSDGRSVVISRYISSKTDEAASLYYSTGTAFEETEPRSGLYHMTKLDRRDAVILVASEPLTFEKSEWKEIPCQTLIVMTPNMNLLQIPIIDQYFQETVAPQRDLRFVDSKGAYFRNK